VIGDGDGDGDRGAAGDDDRGTGAAFGLDTGEPVTATPPRPSGPPPADSSRRSSS
jgi:hypothetical protein